MTHDSTSSPQRRARGLTLIEVVVAASILAIAALALLELLTSSNSIGLSTRRQALAAIEVERALELCSAAIKAGDTLPPAAILEAGMEGEALNGCILTVTTRDSTEEFVIPAAGPNGAPRTIEINIRLLIARVETEGGERIIEAERAVPID